MFGLRMVPRVASTVAPRLACGPVQGLAQVVRGYSTHDEGVLEYLLKVEKDGEEYYRDLAAKAPNKGFQRIFTMLADEEQKHYAAIEDMAHSGETRLVRKCVCARVHAACSSCCSPTAPHIPLPRGLCLMCGAER